MRYNDVILSHLILKSLKAVQLGDYFVKHSWKIAPVKGINLLICPLPCESELSEGGLRQIFLDSV